MSLSFSFAAFDSSIFESLSLSSRSAIRFGASELVSDNLLFRSRSVSSFVRSSSISICDFSNCRFRSFTAMFLS